MASWLDELEAKARAATPGPWTLAKSHSIDGGVRLEHRSIKQLDGPTGLFTNFPSSEAEGAQADCNYAFIAAANPATVLRMVELLRESTEAVRDVAEMLRNEWGPDVKGRYVELLDKLERGEP